MLKWFIKGLKDDIFRGMFVAILYVIMFLVVIFHISVMLFTMLIMVICGCAFILISFMLIDKLIKKLVDKV